MPGAEHPSRVVGFGAFELDLRTGELRKHGVKLKLQNKPRLMLELLLERPGDLVSFADVEKKLWPDEHVEVDRNVGIALFKLRQVLGDSATNPRFIETVPRHGFRFIAPVRQATASVSLKRMLAVLPFDNLSNDPAQEYLADGMTEDLITNLGRVNPSRLGVIARTSAMQYKTGRPSIKQIGEELGVDYVVEGSVRREGTRMRITAQLIRVRDQTHVWAETYDRSGKDILGIETEVAERIATALAVELLPEQRSIMRRSSPGNLEARESYLQGRSHWSRRTSEMIERALDHFEQALTADPDYALAYTGVADSYSLLGFYGDLMPSIAFTKARAAAMRAIELDDRLAEAHSSLAYVTLQYEWNWPRAEREHRRALKLNENYCSAHHWYGLGLMQMGRFREALRALQRAQELDPLSPAVRAQTGRVHYFARQYERAVSHFEEAINMDPNYAPARYFLGLTLAVTRKFEEAIEQLRIAARLSSEHPIAVSGLAWVLSSQGRGGEAAEETDKLERMAKSRHVSPYFRAFALAATDDSPKVFSFLEAALDERFGWMLFLKHEPAFDRVRPTREFIDITQRVEGISQAAGVA